MLINLWVFIIINFKIKLLLTFFKGFFDKVFVENIYSKYFIFRVNKSSKKLGQYKFICYKGIIRLLY